MKSKAFWSILIVLIINLQPHSSFATSSETKPGLSTAKQIYQLIVYHLKNQAQEKRVDQYLSAAFIPAAHHSGIKTVGVFKSIGIDTALDKRVYVLLAYRSLAEMQKANALIEKDHSPEGEDYANATYDNAAYLRKEVILMEAFSAMPALKKPEFRGDRTNRIYELRSYEAATEKLYRNKVSMFNEGNETEIFERIGSQPMFYGEVIAGSRMPNLMYMTTYSDMKSRDEHWKTFSDDAKWKMLSADAKYLHNVSKSDIIFLTSTAYSDL